MDLNDLKYDLDDALNRLKITKSDLDEIRTNLSTVEKIPKDLTYKQLLLFYNACQFSVEETIKVINIYYNIRQSTPEHFENRDANDLTIQQCLDNQIYFVIPPVKKGSNIIIYHRLKNPITSNYIFDNAVKTYCMTIDTALYKYGPTSGITFLFDMKNMRFSHLFRVNLLTLRKFLQYVQYGVPAKIACIHIFNVTSLINRVLSLLRPFVRKELFDIIYTHKSDMNYDEFHKEWIPKSHLPSDYGGDLDSTDDLHSQFINEFHNLQEYFSAEEKQRQIN